MEGRKILADHMTKVEGLQAELSALETQFLHSVRKRRNKKGRMRKKRVQPRKWILSRFLFLKMWTWRTVMVVRRGGDTG